MNVIAGIRRHSRRRWLQAVGLGAALPWAAAAAPARNGEPVVWPEVALLDGHRLAPATLASQAALVVFFSTTCPFCTRHNAHLAKLLREHPGLPLRVLGVARDRDPEVVRRYLAAQRLPIDVTLEAAPLHAALSERRVIPLTCVVDRSGRLREVIPGEMFEEDVMALARWAQA